MKIKKKKISILIVIIITIRRKHEWILLIITYLLHAPTPSNSESTHDTTIYILLEKQVNFILLLSV